MIDIALGRTATLEWLDPRQIDADVTQPRRQVPALAQRVLTASIRAIGIFQPLGVAALPDGRYRLLWGERRWQVALALDLDTVPCVVRPTPTWHEALQLQLADHATSLPLAPQEQAAALWRLVLGVLVVAEEEAQRDNGAETAQRLAHAATPAAQVAALVDRLCELLEVATLAQASARARWEYVPALLEASGVAERGQALRSLLATLRLPAGVEDALVGADPAGLMVQALAQGDLVAPVAEPEPWSESQARLLEAALGQALAVCTEAPGRVLTERQARRVRLRLAALQRALDEAT
ncbi:MAG TPA: ParB/RepB/Spo0J family partition protein [Roseiflexaceae bacterium]|nr:ParB/RepB/Spo0J family partition protein [Roseiflexaceae bacterium]